MNGLIPNENGVWIQCCNAACKKWRYSLDHDDPLQVPTQWYCRMNTDTSINDCSKPEYLELGKEEIFVMSKFKAGSIVWAKVIGRPWSVGMIDFCPDHNCYYWFDNEDTNVPSQYHVRFFNEKEGSRAWLKTSFIKSFVANNDPAFALKARLRGKKLSARKQAVILESYAIAQAASRLSVASRLKEYSPDSWQIVKRLRSQFPNSRKKPSVAESQIAGPSQAADKNTGTQNESASTVLDDTHSISFTSKDFSEVSVFKETSTSVAGNAVEMTINDASPNEDSDNEIIPSSNPASPVKDSFHSSFSLLNNKKWKTNSNREDRTRKAAAGSSKNKENYPENSRYLRALSEFKLDGQNLPSKSTSNYQQYQSKINTLPRCFTDIDEIEKNRRNFIATRSRLNDENYIKIHEGYQAKFRQDTELSGSSNEENRAKSRPTNYFRIAQKWDPEFTSDED